MNDYQTERSRLSSRGRKRKQNRLMNLLIAIVCILIVIVAGSIFFGGSEKADQPLQTSSEGSNNNGDNGSGASVTDDSDKDNTDEAGTDESGTSTTEGTNGSGMDDSQTGTDDQQQNQSNQKDDQKKQDQQQSGGSLEGPWKPIGTTQEPPHVSSYERGSVDWNEKVDALLYATGLTGLNEDEYILWRLGNGGGPQKSIGKLSTNAKPHELYIVHLSWVKNKGWKPTSVEKVHKENLPD